MVFRPRYLPRLRADAENPEALRSDIFSSVRRMPVINAFEDSGGARELRMFLPFYYNSNPNYGCIKVTLYNYAPGMGDVAELVRDTRKHFVVYLDMRLKKVERNRVGGPPYSVYSSQEDAELSIVGETRWDGTERIDRPFPKQLADARRAA